MLEERHLAASMLVVFRHTASTADQSPKSAPIISNVTLVFTEAAFAHSTPDVGKVVVDTLVTEGPRYCRRLEREGCQRMKR